MTGAVTKPDVMGRVELDQQAGRGRLPQFLVRRRLKNELRTSFDALCSIKGSSHEGGKLNLQSAEEEF